jgi:peptide subunit release factor 1 (eRF1)
MITAQAIQRLIQRDAQDREIVSLFLDMSVNSDNKRTHSIFLAKEKAAFAELQSDRDRNPREPIGAIFARIERWLDEEYDPTNSGVAIYAEVGGDWFEAFQFPTPVANRFQVHAHPVIGPLTQIVRSHPQYGVIIVDREHLRLVSIHMGKVGEDYTQAPDAIPTPHDVQAGGYSQKDYQKRKAEEVRHFFRDFAEEVGRFDQRVKPEFFVLLGTTENTRGFLEFLPRPVQERVVHEGHAPSPSAASGPELVRHLQPVFEELATREQARALDLLQERVRQAHFATSGIHDTLVQLQEGKVDRLVVASGLEREGVQCTQCSFYLVRRDGACPYCGGELRDGVDLVESMIRIAANQAAQVDFVTATELSEMNGVGALLKF